MSVAGSPVDLSDACDVVRRAVHRHEIPGAVALVRWRGETVLHEAFGWAALQPERRPMTFDTIFDLASLTKPLVTAPLILQLADRGVVSLDHPVRRYLPAMGQFADGRVTIRQLILHTSGLPAWRPLYVWARTRSGVLQAIARSEQAYVPGSKVVYSCLGYIILGLLVEEMTGASLDDTASHLIFDRLGLSDVGFGSRVDAERCAWTECGNPYERSNVVAQGHSFDNWRTDFYPGDVHDGNAWYAMSGVSGNAGLFGTAREVAMLGQTWLDGGRAATTRMLREETLAAATKDWTSGLDEARGLGWQINRPPSDETGSDVVAPRSAGTRLSARAFGHTGFTGTSLWIDPELDMVAVLLTNRVHPVVEDDASIVKLRGCFHDSVATALDDVAQGAPSL